MKQAHEHKCMKLKGELARTVPTASIIHGVKPWLFTLKPNRNKWTSVMSYRSSLWNVDLIADNEDPDGRNWLIRLREQAIWTASFYFLYLLWLSISKILALSLPTPQLHDPLHRHVWLISIFREDPVWDYVLCSWSRTARGLPVSPM
jgi:uncharacterized membrane protein